MARLRQQHPQNYTSSGNISVEFENLVRYLNAAEIGNKTIAELLDSLFDDEGNLQGSLEMRYDPSIGLQFRFARPTSSLAGYPSPRRSRFVARRASMSA